MGQVWVQVWSAQVPGAVLVEELELRQVQGLESVKAMVPMLVEVQETELEKAQRARETALSKGWGWVLREREKE
jgi:hypothetical protein